MNSVFVAFAVSLLLTLALELIVGIAFRLRSRDILLLTLVNILTNPAAVYLDMLCRRLWSADPYLWQIPIELAVVAVEGLCYMKLSDSVRRPWLLAISANVFSYGVGIILNLIL